MFTRPLAGVHNPLALLSVGLILDLKKPMLNEVNWGSIPIFNLVLFL